MIIDLIKENYGIDADRITKMKGGWSSDVYLVEAGHEKYVLKGAKANGMNHQDNEVLITRFLLNRDIKVSELLPAMNEKFIWQDGDIQYHLQKYVDGETLELNTAPDWFMKKSARTLGKIHKELLSFHKLPVGMGDDFFKYSSPENAKKSYMQTLEHAERIQDEEIVTALESRLRQIEKLKSIKPDNANVTFSNTHGDYYIYQMICQNEDFTVIDWTSACVHPICWEVIRSFASADIGCRKQGFDVERFFAYLHEYLQYFPLNKYDLKMMPYIFYYQLGVCNYYHSYYFEEGADREMVLKISNLATNLMNWFYDNVDELSDKLVSLVG